MPSDGMEPTLRLGSSISADTDARRPKVGAIVVFHPPRRAPEDPTSPRCPGAYDTPSGRACSVVGTQESSASFVKRVVAIGGDTVAFRDGRTVRNGRTASEPFRACPPRESSCTLPAAITLPPRTLYVVGDNRVSSMDSRDWGPIREEWVIGTVKR